MLALIDPDAIISAWTTRLGMPWEGLFRLFLAAGAGGLIGLERELRGRQAGLRTNILISVGAALVMVVSCAFAQRPWKPQANVNINVDPARLAYGVMAGVGLLCAGPIIKEWGRISGLTTAAGVWCSAAVGLSAGFGLYSLTIGAMVLIITVLWLLQIIERVLPRMRYTTIIVRRRWTPDCVAITAAHLTKAGFFISDLNFRRSADLSTVQIHVKLGFVSRQQFHEIAKKIEGDPTLDLLAAKDL